MFFSGAFRQLRVGIALITLTGLSLALFAIFMLLSTERRFGQLSDDFVPLLIRLDGLNQTAFELTRPATTILANPTGPDVPELGSQMAAIVDNLRQSVDNWSFDDQTVRKDISAKLVTAENATGILLNAIKERETIAPDAAAILVQHNSRVIDLAELVTIHKTELLKEMLSDPSASAEHLNDVNRLFAASEDLSQIEQAIGDMTRATTIENYDRAETLVKLNFGDLFLTLSRMENLNAKQQIATSASDIYSSFLSGEASEPRRQYLRLTNEITSQTNELLLLITDVKEAISTYVELERLTVTGVAQDVHTDIKFSVTLLVAAALLALALTGLIVFIVIEQRIIRRLKVVQAQSAAIRGGDFGPQPMVTGSDEIAVLSRSMEDLRHQHQLELRLRQETEVARAIAAAKSEFLSMMSHEIRTPLNAIMGIFELIADADIPDRQKLRARHGRSAAQGLYEVLSKILDASRLEARQVQFVPRSMSIPTLRNYLEATLDGTVGKSERPLKWGLVIDVDVPKEIVSDEGQIRQILTNLIDNAVRFTPEGRVDVSVSTGTINDRPSVKFAVQDTGIGISEADQAMIFQQFQQVDQGPTRSRGGSGLGLTISRRLAELLGGSLTLESSPHMGSKFTLEIPQNPVIQ